MGGELLLKLSEAVAWEPTERWSITDASELYDVASWGKGYFSIGSNGHLWVHPNKEPARGIDLRELVEKLELRGIYLPILIRFAEILKHRLAELHQAFDNSIAEHGYKGGYCCVYPIKVNQQRQVVEEVLKYGRPYHFGLEAGSKPELLAVLAIADNETPIICNGFKDDEYIEMVMLAKKIGRRIIPVVEKYTELDLILKHSQRVGVRPVIGLRLKLASKGSGRWKSSGGYRSKFGLTVSEALQALDQMKAAGMEDCLELLHFHLGSQITNIRQIKAAVNEAARIYVELKRAGAGLKYLDVGGGLGIDYDGSQTDFESSVNYTLQEYSNDVVYHIQNVCEEADVPHPTIISESGRAIAAYHSVLVFNVLGVSGFGDDTVAPVPEDAEQPLIDLQETFKSLSSKNLLESFHDAQQALDSALNLFNLGYLPLAQRSQAENLYWAICRRILKMAKELEFFPEELEGLDGMLSDTYFCNFSLFQSVPDSWAVKQLFPDYAHPPAERNAFARRGLGRYFLRFGRQNRPVHRSPGCQENAAPASVQRRALRAGRIPGGRLPGNSGRPAQSVRRYQCSPRQPGRERRRHPGHRDSRRHRAGGAGLRSVQRQDLARGVPARCGDRAARRTHRL